MHDVASEVTETARTYRQDEDRPLGGYLAVMAVFAALIAGAVGLAAATGRRLPNGMSPFDVLLGTHKLSRILSKDAVTSPLRAPFTQYRETGGPEVMEDARTTGPVRHAVGELLTCPFCLDVWMVAGFTVGLLYAPRIASTLAALTGADFLQFAYAKAQQAGT
jgi:hypothetical protein